MVPIACVIMKSMTMIDEKELLTKLRSGDRMAFTEIYDRYKVQITARLFTVLKVDALVEDTLQELFFRIWEKRTGIDPDKPIINYISRIAANLSYDHFRRLAREQRFMTSKDIGEMRDAENVYQKELDQALYNLIDQLPTQRKKVFLLCKFENKSYEEISDQLGISTNAVKDHIVKANKFLKNNYYKIAHLAGYCIALQTIEKFL